VVSDYAIRTKDGSRYAICMYAETDPDNERKNDTDVETEQERQTD